MAERRYGRTERVREVLREVMADTLERIDDTRLELVSITGVDVDREMRQARVWVDSDKPEALAALAEHRVRLQQAIGRESRLPRTPRLEFAPDPAILGARRVEDILRGLADEQQQPDD